MRTIEFLLSLTLALLVLVALVAWTRASDTASTTARSCQSGRQAAPVLLKGMSLYHCPAGRGARL